MHNTSRSTPPKTPVVTPIITLMIGGMPMAVEMSTPTAANKPKPIASGSSMARSVG
ncbi:hypothetical protein D3C87_2014590 [compost metagenome]